MFKAHIGQKVGIKTAKMRISVQIANGIMTTQDFRQYTAFTTYHAYVVMYT